MPAITHRKRRATWYAPAAVLAIASAAASGSDERTPGAVQGPTGETPVGLAIEVDNGAGVPLQVRRGQIFYVNQIDLRASVTATVDEGVSALATRGDFAGLPWSGIHVRDEDFVLLSNPDKTYTRRRFFAGAAWMRRPSRFVLEQHDSSGRRIGTAMAIDAGSGHDSRSSDAFFVRRLRAIQWTRDCRAAADCTGARVFEEEALVELRSALHPEHTFRIDPRTVALRLEWSLSPRRPYVIPLTQVAEPRYAYGFAIDVEAVTPPRADGTYAPGREIAFRLTLKDGAGNRLHPPGALPSYNDVVRGVDPSGIQYYRAFTDPTTTFWRRKHRERMLMAEFAGPAQNAGPIRTILDLDRLLGADDVQVTGTPAADGQHAEFRTFPTSRDLFGGAFDPAHAGWAAPVPDTWTHRIPADARPGTYYVHVKGRRTYLGEDIAASKTIEVQVGSPAHTQPALTTGRCATCHSGPSSLDTVLHANGNRGTCGGCHVPLGFELEGPIYVRTHFIHSRSDRFDAALTACATCHLANDSIQRTSKSACLSCHRSYPRSHVDEFGPITHMYVGGGRESFGQCSSSCHTTHPRSGF